MVKKSLLLICAAVMSFSRLGPVGCGGGGGSDKSLSRDLNTLIERSVIHLSQDGEHSVQTESITLGTIINELQVRHDSNLVWDANTSSCGPESLMIFDSEREGEFESMACFFGIGTVSLGAVPKGSGTWIGEVKSFWPGEDSGFISILSSAGYFSQNFKPSDGLVIVNEDVTDANNLTLYRLKPATDTWEGVHRFLISDVGLTALDIANDVIKVDFIWSADSQTPLLNAANPDIILGHYNPVNGIDNGRYGRCISNEDCLLPGYTCTTIPLNPQIRFTYWMGGDPVCYHSDLENLRACTTNDDCAAGGFPGNCWEGKCMLSPKQSRTIEYKYWATHHPDWIIYRCDASQKPLHDTPLAEDVAWFWDAANFPFDFTNPHVQNEIFRRIRMWGEIGGKNEYSALALDVVYPANYTGACGVYRDGAWTPIFSGSQRFDHEHPDCAENEGYCDPKFTDALIDWLKRVRDEVHKDGLHLVANVGYGGSLRRYVPIPPSNSRLQEVFEIVDGVLNEAGFTKNFVRQPGLAEVAAGVNPCESYPFNGTYLCGIDGDFDIWSYQGEYMKSVQSLGKSYYNKNGVRLAGTPQEPAIEWAFASYLLNKGHNANFYFCDNPDDGADRFYPQVDIAIGHPCEDMQHTDGTKIYTRRYSHGFVAANAGSNVDPAQSIALPAGITFYRWDSSSNSYSTQMSSPPVLEYQQGLVLYAPDKLCP